MKISARARRTARVLALPLVAIGAVHAMPAMAQDDTTVASDDTGPRYNGVYIGFGVGATMEPNHGQQSLVFNRGGGPTGNGLSTATGANAFSPGFCGGAFNSTTPGDCRPDRLRPDYSVKIGVDSRSGRFVAGVLLEGQINRTRSSISAFSTTPAAYQITRGLDYGFSLRGRLGFTPDYGGGLFYVTGGPSYSRLRHTFVTTNAANQFTSSNDGSWVLGAQAGGGGEVMVTPHVGLGIEYLYNHFRDNKYYVTASQGSAPATNPFVLGGTTTTIRNSYPNYNFHTVRATLSFHF